jgi:hypothetical protein
MIQLDLFAIMVLTSKSICGLKDGARTVLLCYFEPVKTYLSMDVIHAWQ